MAMSGIASCPTSIFHAGKLRLFAQPMLSGISGVRRARRPGRLRRAPTCFRHSPRSRWMSRTTLRCGCRRGASSYRWALGASSIRAMAPTSGKEKTQAFDGFDMSLTGKAWQVTALYFRPVDNRLDDFDDRTSTQKALWGVYATRWLGRRSDQRLRHLLSRSARPQRGLRPGRRERAGPHLRHPRYSGDTGPSYWNA